MILKRIILSFLFVCFVIISFSQNKFWEQTNGPTGGRVMSLSMDALGTLYCGTQGGTLFQYAVNEQLWKPLFLGATRDNIISIVTDEDRLYFATTRDGLFRSRPQNSGWEKINTGIKDSESVGLAILANGILFVATKTGLYKSVNHGDNWIKVETINKPVNTLVVDKQFIYVAHSDSLISYSSDAGQNWKNLPTLKNKSVTCLAVGNDQQLYAATKSGDILKVAIGNSIWKTITTFNYPVWVLQRDGEENIYAGLGGPDFSNEGGGVYFISDDLERPMLLFPESIWCMIIRNKVIYTGSTNGIHYTDKNSIKLIPLNSGLIAQRVNDIVINKNDEVFIGSYGGVYSSNDYGNTWLEKNNGLNERGIVDMAINSKGHLFVGTYTSSVFRSTDSGNSWQKSCSGIPAKNSHWIMSLALNSHDQIFAAVLAGGVYRSLDNGESWQAVNNGLETQRYIALVIDANDVIYAANENGDVFSSGDNGKTWIKLEVKNPIEEAAAELAIDSENQLYFGAIEKGIFRYNKKEKRWIQLNNGLANTSIRSLIFINSDSMFAGTSGTEDYKNFYGLDVYRSNNKGENWTLEKSGLNHPRIKALAINSKGFLFAGTWGGGVYKSVFPVR